ncbi:MAG: AgmX/PglI C-terminal domain-containing protein [Alphaproteobacteria bacterium]|nr:AgmX/PglI C-terminal domain-containing protein [Alphaproteobacteria bacterium]MCB9791793.1 AgmX/PglI C-terminal domain-containing protein [Alphaproteobacteria bacterium]
MQDAEETKGLKGRGDALLILLALAGTALALVNPVFEHLSEPAPVEDAPEAGATPSDGRFREPSEEKLIARGEPGPQVTDNKATAESVGLFADPAALDDALGGPGLDPGTSERMASLMGAKGAEMGSGGLSSRGEGLDGGGETYQLSDRRRKEESAGRTRGWDPYHLDTPIIDPSRSGAPIILGALDRDQIDRVIEGAMPRITTCYRDELAEHPELGGKLVNKFVVTKDGSVSSAATKSSTMGHPPTEDCVAEVLRSLRYPPPRGGGIVIVSYPFLFSPY